MQIIIQFDYAPEFLPVPDRRNDGRKNGTAYWNNRLVVDQDAKIMRD